ncbi:MAG TPA: hypothetical protein PLV72_01935 [Candidatus Magasanikbacteria bacterium]|nr:hypothetical protein [Candidatus Magasanikbacteria bacterium]
MKSKLASIIFLFGIVGATLVGGEFVSAQINPTMVNQVTSQINAGATSAGYGGAVNPYTVTANYVKMFLSLIGTIFFVMILWGGYEYFTAKGDEDQAKTGLKYIKAAIIGLAIVLASYSITIFIVTRSQAAIGDSPVGESAVYK